MYLSAKFGSATKAELLYSAITAAGRAEGIEFAFERIRHTPNTLRAHRLIRVAGDKGCAEPVVEALFQAYFIEGLDIGLTETLGELAGRAGLGRAETLEYLRGDAGTAEVRADQHRARRLGIHAVPYFVLERDYAISGAQEPEMFLPIFDIAAGIVEPAPAEA